MIDVGLVREGLASLTKAERELTGTYLQRTVVDTAAALGFRWCHWRAAPTRRGPYRVPVEGTLGVGWPDLFLLNEHRRVALAIEIKSWADFKRNGLPDAQLDVLDLLTMCGIPATIISAADIRDPLETSPLIEFLTRRP